MSELWTVARAAKYLDVSRKRVYQLILSGHISSLKLSPRTTRVVREGVEVFLTAQIEIQRRELGLDIAPHVSPHRQRPRG